jgi:hypothetical protein
MLILAAFFNEPFWQQIVGTLLGVLGGLGVAYGIYVLQNRDQASQSETRRKQLVDMVKRCVQDNQDRLKRLKEGLEGEVSSSNVDVATLEWLLQQDVKTPLGDVIFSEQMTKLRCEWALVHKYVDILIAVRFAPENFSFESNTGWAVNKRQQEELKKIIPDHVIRSLKLCEQVLEHLPDQNR